MQHLTPIRVRGYHLDLYGHVNNARYLEFLEEARWNWLDDAGVLDWFLQHKLALVVSRIDIQYLRPASMGDLLQVSTELSALSRRNGSITQRITRQDNGKDIVRATVTFAVLDPAHRGAQLIEGEVAARLSPLLSDITGANA